MLGPAHRRKLVVQGGHKRLLLVGQLEVVIGYNAEAPVVEIQRKFVGLADEIGKR